MSFLRTLDSLTFNFFPATSDMTKAVKYRDKLGGAMTAIDLSKNCVEQANTTVSLCKKVALFLSIVTGWASGSVSKALDVLHKFTALEVIAGLGIVISSLVVLFHSISIHIQNKVIECIPDDLTEDNIVQAIEALEEINYNQFIKALPTDLAQQIEKKGGNFFKELKARAQEEQGDYFTEVKRKLEEIKDYAFRKKVLHILSIISGVVSLVGSIGLLVGFPPLALTFLAIAGIALTVTCIMVSKGWVNNNQKGFNYKLALPEFLQKKMGLNKEEGTELKNWPEKMEALNIHNEILNYPRHCPISRENSETSNKVNSEESNSETFFSNPSDEKLMINPDRHSINSSPQEIKIDEKRSNRWETFKQLLMRPFKSQ